MLNLSAVPIYEDNYIWVLHQGSKAIAVDPGEAAPLQAWLHQHQCELTAILITHHHWDHIGGLAALANSELPIYGPAAIAHINRPLQGGESLTLLGENFTVMATPGHTLDHLSYFGAGALFCGDTLFSAGCGRLFEGTPAQMLASLQQFARLPGETKVCCTHEYTQSNLRFALAVDPNNAALHARDEQVRTLRATGQMSLPSTIAIERASNPFLRCDQLEVMAAARTQNANIANTIDTFTALRQWKDHFR